MIEELIRDIYISRQCFFTIVHRASQMVKRKEANAHKQNLGDEIENPATQGVRVSFFVFPSAVCFEGLVPLLD